MHDFPQNIEQEEEETEDEEVAPVVINANTTLNDTAR
jgi:hypothetical protein